MKSRIHARRRSYGKPFLSLFFALVFASSLCFAQDPEAVTVQKRCCDTAAGAWFQDPTYYMSEAVCNTLEGGAWEDTEEADVCVITPDPWPDTGAPVPAPYNCGGCVVKLAAPKPPHACYELVGMWVTCNLTYVPGVSWGTDTGLVTIRSNTQVIDFGTKCDVVAAFFWGMKADWGRGGRLPDAVVETLQTERQFYEAQIKPRAKGLPHDGELPQLRLNDTQNRKN